MAKRSDPLLIDLCGPSDAVVLDARVLASSRGVIQGSSGSGKSFLARLIGEQIADHMPLIIIDPEGEYFTMRERCSMVLVGSGGEIRCDPSTAAKVARGLLKESCSAIVDLSDLPARDHCRYVGSFIDAMMHAPRSCWRPTLVFIDEAHRFCPEGGNKRAVDSSDAIKDLMSRGRKRGYGGVLLTQRISKVSKDAVAEGANQFFGITYQDVDIKRTADTLGMSTRDAQVLRTLQRGEWLAHGPALHRSCGDMPGVMRFQAQKPATKSPDEGGYEPPVKNASAIKRLALSVEESIAGSAGPLTLEEAEQAIADLRAQVESLSSAPADGVGREEAARLGRQLADARRDLARSRDQATRAMGGAEEIVKKLVSDHEKMVAAIARLVTTRPGPCEHAVMALGALSDSLGICTPDQAAGTLVEGDRAGGRGDGDASPSITTIPSGPGTTARSPEMNGSAEERMLAALAWWRAAGVDHPSPVQIGLVAGVSAKSSTFRSARASLRQRGLVEYHGKSTGLTAAGRDSLGGFMPSPSMSGWHQMIRDQIGSGATLRVFDHLAAVGSCSKEALAEACGISVDSSTIRSAIAVLRNLGLVAKGQPIRATGLMRPRHLL